MLPVVICTEVSRVFFVLSFLFIRPNLTMSTQISVSLALLKLHPLFHPALWLIYLPSNALPSYLQTRTTGIFRDGPNSFPKPLLPLPQCLWANSELICWTVPFLKRNYMQFSNRVLANSCRVNSSTSAKPFDYYYFYSFSILRCKSSLCLLHAPEYWIHLFIHASGCSVCACTVLKVVLADDWKISPLALTPSVLPIACVPFLCSFSSAVTLRSQSLGLRKDNRYHSVL